MLLSVIIPVYNVEKYIKKCLDSIVQQVDSDVEVILIDDGSTDSSLDICKAYQKKYPNIRVWHKNNGGVASARNLGLEKAQGTYIAWVDPDDYVSDKWYSAIKSTLISRTPDCLIFDYYTDYYGKIQTHKSNLPYEVSLSQYLYELSADTRLNSFLPLKVIKSILYENLHFDETATILEDYKLITAISPKLRSIVNIDAPLYYYVRRKESLTNNVTLQKRKIAYEIAGSRYNAFKPLIDHVSKAGYWKTLILFCLTCSSDEQDFQGSYQKCKRILRLDFGNILKSSEMSMARKFVVFLINLGFTPILSVIWDTFRANRYK